MTISTAGTAPIPSASPPKPTSPSPHPNASLMRGTGEVHALNNIEVANLKGGAGNNVFTLTGWTGNGSLTGGGGNDTLVWAADANFTLSNLSLTVTPVSGPESNFTLSSIETA